MNAILMLGERMNMLTAHGFDIYTVANESGSYFISIWGQQYSWLYLFRYGANYIRGGAISVVDYVCELSFTLRGSLITSPVLGA